MLHRLYRFIRSFFTDNRPPRYPLCDEMRLWRSAAHRTFYMRPGETLNFKHDGLGIPDYMGTSPAPVEEPHHRTREGRIVYYGSINTFDQADSPEVISGRNEATLRSLGRCTLPDGREGVLTVAYLPDSVPADEETPADPGNGNGEGDSTRGD